MSNIFSQSPHTLFTQQVEVVNHYRLFIDNLVQEGVDLHDILNKLHGATELDTLEVRINSGGGFIRYGQQLINVMRDKFRDRCVTVLDAEASSMAAVLFMSGDSRVIYPHSILMVHDVSMYLGGKASESRKQMEVFLPVFEQYFRSIFGETMTDAEIKRTFDGDDMWFNAEMMCERGMADHVIVDGVPISAEEYLTLLREVEEEDEVVYVKPKKAKKKKKGKKREANSDS